MFCLSFNVDEDNNVMVVEKIAPLTANVTNVMAVAMNLVVRTYYLSIGVCK